MNMRQGKLKKLSRDVLIYAGLTLVLFVFLFPIFFMYLTSFKPYLLQITEKPVWFFKPVLDSYRWLFTKTQFVSGLYNSVIISLGSLSATLILGCLAAYALARFTFRGKENLAFWILSLRMFPPIVAVLPFFILFTQWHLIDTKLGLILVYIFGNLPLCIWLMRGFYEEIPVELDEAALVDGCSRWSVFTRIIFPLSKGGLFATGIFLFVLSWNEFLFALILSESEAAKTAPIVVAGMLAKQGLAFGPMCAATSLLSTPIFVFSLFLGKYLLRGLTFGAVKG